MLLILHCKTMYCQRRDLLSTSTVGNANEWNSKIRNGLIPGRKSLKKRRQAVFFTTMNPMEVIHDTRETPCDLTKPRIAPHKNTWKSLQNTVFWCNWKIAQRKICIFNQTQSHVVVLYNTLPAACTAKAACMKTQDVLCQKVRLTWRVLRVVQNRTLKIVHKIHKAKKQDHLGNHRAARKVTGKPVATPCITEYLEYLFPQSSRRIQYARTKSKG